MAETSPSLSALCKELASVQGKWFKIGIHSNVPYEKLQEFKKEDYPLAAVFNYCLKGNLDKPLTWKSIVDTLKSEDVEEGGLAETISKKYCLEEKEEKSIEKANTKEKPQEDIKHASEDIKHASPKHKAAESLYPGCYLFVNDSNLWIAGQKASAKHLKDADTDRRFRVDLGRFVNLLTKGRNILGAYLYGSRPPPNDTVWKAAREKNFQVDLFERSGTGQEKALNTAMATQITKTIYTLDAQEKDEVVFITVTGDRDLKPPIDDALDNQIRVELWSWQDSMSREFRQLANTNSLFTANALDGREKAFSYTSYMSSRYRDINPAKAIVYRDVPKSKRFLYEFADYLHQLMRVFYITPVPTKEGMQDLIVEFPKTKPEVILKKIKTLRNFPYKPCSYPEYTMHTRRQVKVVLVLTNRFKALGNINIDGELNEENELDEEAPPDMLKLEEAAVTASRLLSSEQTESNGEDEDVEEDDSEEDGGDWASVLYKNPTLLAQVRRRRDLQCKWKDHCARGSNCRYKHTEEEKALFANFPNVRFNYRKTRLCNKRDQHTTEQQRKRCTFAHTDEDSWCIKCAMYGHLTDNCKVKVASPEPTES